MPDASGRFKGISVPRIPWDNERKLDEAEEHDYNGWCGCSEWSDWDGKPCGDIGCPEGPARPFLGRKIRDH